MLGRSILVLLIATSRAFADIAYPVGDADALLKAGEFESALDMYDSIIKTNQEDYMAIFKRGALYMSLGRDMKALADFDKVVELHPGMTAAKQQRTKLRVKMGRYEEADSEASEEEKADMKLAKESQKAAEAAFLRKDYGECIVHANTVVQISPMLVDIRILRGDCRVGQHDYFEAVNDYSHAEKGTSRSELYVKSAEIYFYMLNEYELAMGQLRRCLQFDQDDKQCKVAHKAIRGTNKSLKGMKVSKGKMKDWKKIFGQVVGEKLLDRVVEDVRQIQIKYGVLESVQTSLLVQYLYAVQCESAYRTGQFDPKYCEHVVEVEELEGDPNTEYDAGLYKILVQVNHLSEKEEYQQAISVISNAPQKYKAHLGELYQKMQIALKQANSKNYYKVLDVSKTSNEKEIKAAYRKLSKIYHPDKAKGGDEEAAQKKMAEINEAYEVLSDPELKSQYDSGHDPNDQSPPQGHPFQQGFNPFGGGFGGAGGFQFQQGGAHFKFQQRQH